jgi:colanic acid biosynthesis glycosyl transferase WcaI
MRILITTQVFPPEIHPTARIVWELARSLSDAGHYVTVAAGYPHHPHGSVLGGYQKKWILRETVDGVRVVRGWHFTSMSSAILARGFVYFSQTLGTAMASLADVRPEALINFGPPLVGPAVSALLAGHFGARHVPIIYDLYPDLAIEAGAIRNRPLIWAAKAMERWAYGRSDRIVVLSEGFRRTLVDSKGVPEEKIRVIPVWLDLDEIQRAQDPLAWRREHGISEDTFVVLYAGTMGIVSGVEILLDVAKEFSSDLGIVFLFVGEGRAKDRIQEQGRDLPNVRLFAFQPRETLSEMLSSADVGIMTLLPGRGRTSVPSKMLGYMAVGVPVLASCDLDSDSARMIREAKCGAVVPPGDALEIANALRKLRSDIPACHSAGQCGRTYLEKHHSRDSGTKAFLSLLGEFTVFHV